MATYYWDKNHIPAEPSVLSGHVTHERRVNLSGLSQQLKKQVWPLMQRDAPALAGLLDDGTVASLANEFGPLAVTVAWDDLPVSVQRVIEGK